ncbi:hypothetical protein [Geodermatophilus sp. SYSU D01105]
MPVWTVRIAVGDEERVEAEMLATEGGALVALAEDGLLVRAWAPGEWRTARHVDTDPLDPMRDGDGILVGLPRV